VVKERQKPQPVASDLLVSLSLAVPETTQRAALADATEAAAITSGLENIFGLN